MSQTNIATVEDFLADFRRHLRGLMPENYADALTDEQEFWLERRIRDEVICGSSYDQATLEVLAKHGKPAVIAKKCIAEYYQEEVRSPLYNCFGRANVTANTIFGLANAAFLVFLQLKVYLPDPGAIGLGFTPAQARLVFPEPLPFPDFSLTFWITVCYPVLAPIVAGWICGRLIPVGASGAVYRVLMYMIVAAFLMGVALLPQQDALLYAVALTVYWLPVGCLTAHISSSLYRKARNKATARNGSHPSFASNLKSGLPI